jgi:surface antigen
LHGQNGCKWEIGMTPLKSILVAAGGLAVALCAAPADGQVLEAPGQAAESAIVPPPQSGPSPTTEADLRQTMSGERAGTAIMAPRGRPRRRAPRFAPFAAGGGQGGSGEIHPFPEDLSDPFRSACNQELTAQQRAENRREAEQVTDLLNRMAEAANRMSVRQAQQNGAQVTPGLVPRAGSDITAAVERMLNCDEQRQAAEATERALVGPVGTAVAWTSESRPGVSGSSTVTAVETAAVDGSQCLTVTDVVIIDGAETRAPKRMCRIPPSTRYVRA